MLSETTVGTWTFFRLMVCFQAIKVKPVLPYNLFSFLSGFALENRIEGDTVSL